MMQTSKKSYFYQEILPPFYYCAIGSYYAPPIARPNKLKFLATASRLTRNNTSSYLMKTVYIELTELESYLKDVQV